MSEFCFKCFNKYCVSKENRIKKEDAEYLEDFCGGCGKYKPCVVKIKKDNFKKPFLFNFFKKLI